MKNIIYPVDTIFISLAYRTEIPIFIIVDHITFILKMDATGFHMTFYGKGFSEDYQGDIKYVLHCS